MNRSLLVLALLATLAATACKPKAPADAEPAAQANTAAEAPAPVAPAAAPAEAPFDIKGFAGTFAAGEAKIVLNADGTYALTGATADDGTWTAEENGKRIRLDSNSKAVEDRLYAIVSHDQLDQVDAAGAAVTPAQSFTREGATK